MVQGGRLARVIRLRDCPRLLDDLIIVVCYMRMYDGDVEESCHFSVDGERAGMHLRKCVSAVRQRTQRDKEE